MKEEKEIFETVKMMRAEYEALIFAVAFLGFIGGLAVGLLI